MATVRIPAENRTLTDQTEVTAYLATLGIDYERWPLSQRAAANAPAEAVLASIEAPNRRRAAVSQLPLVSEHRALGLEPGRRTDEQGQRDNQQPGIHFESIFHARRWCR